MTPTVSSKAFILLVLLLACLLLHDATAKWVETAKLVDSDGEEDFFGESVAIDNGILVVGAPLDGIDGVEVGSTTIFEWSDGEWVAPQKLTASDAEEFDFFGTSVAISNGVVAVGAAYDDDGGTWAGAVYIYEKGAYEAWTENQKLIHGDAAAFDQFGQSLAMQGKTLVVGVRGDDSGCGSAYVYTLMAGALWTQAAKLTANDRSAFDEFGYSVAIDAETVVVGAWVDDDLGSASGSAYVFQRAGEDSSWMQVAKLTPSDGQSVDYFGRSVAIEGGIIFVGSDNQVDGSYVGAVYQFGEEGGTWTQQSKLVARDFATNDRLGLGLAVRGGTLVVGATTSSTRFAIDAGAVYLFEHSAEGTWTQRAKLVARDGAADDRFGHAVAIDDGMVIAGAYADNLGQGSVYAFEWRAPSCPAGLIRCGLCTFFGVFCRYTEVTQSPTELPSVGPSEAPSVQPSSVPTSM